MDSVGQAFRQSPAVMTSLFCDIWGFCWKIQRLDWSWRIHFQGGLVTWLGPLHQDITVGLLECPLDMAQQVIQEVMLEVMMSFMTQSQKSQTVIFEVFC